jgi:hypothetical protein
MRRAMTAALSTGRRYRASRSYRTLRYLLASPGLAYVMLLSFPQLLFGYEVSHNNFKVYTREPIDPVPVRSSPRSKPDFRRQR